MLGTPVLYKENRSEDHRHHPRIVDGLIRTGTTQRPLPYHHLRTRQLSQQGLPE